MKKQYEIYEMIKNASYKKVVLDLDYTVITDKKDKTVFLVFQETTSKLDWITNFTFPVKMYKSQQGDFLVHSGWAKAWKSGNDQVMADFINAVNDHPDYSTCIVGWSYGGAIALFAAEDFYFRVGKKIDVLETFGAPKPLFGKKSKSHFKNAVNLHLQYAHVNDCVPLAPPFMGYTNLGNINLQKKDWWKFWKLFNPWKWHCDYGNLNYYK